MAMSMSAVSSEVMGWAKSLIGGFVDEDGAYGAQCKDLISHYIRVVHGEPYTRGNGDQMAANLVSQRGWTAVGASSPWQIGDVVSTTGIVYGGHVYVVLEDLGSTVKMVDQNGGASPTGRSGSITIRTVSKSDAIGAARPPRYVGATGGSTPAPAPSAQSILGKSLENADAIVKAAQRVGLPVHLVAALIEGESGGKNIYGHDGGGLFSTASGPVTIGGTTYPQGSNIPVTDSNFKEFESRLLSGGTIRPGVTSNGVGPAQITYWSLFPDARRRGFNLADPVDNIAYGAEILRRYLGGDYSQDSIEEGGTLYNVGNLRSGVNYYGLRLWKLSEKWRRALAGSTIGDSGDGGGGTDPAEPLDPAEIIPADQTDPGPTADLLKLTSTEPRPLPDPEPGPRREPELIVQTLVRVWWRDRYWAPLSGGIDREIPTEGPDQSPAGAGLTAATGEITLARPWVLTNFGWNPWRDNPPVEDEPVMIEGSDDGGDTWHRLFVGKVAETGGTTTDIGVTMSLVDNSDRLDFNVRHPPLNFRHPAPDDGKRYLSIGLHPAYFAHHVARYAGFLSTPPMDSATTLVSVPMVGSVWPERGDLIGSKTMDEKGSSEGISDDSPEYRSTWWGMTVSNVFYRVRPDFPEGVTGRLTRMMGLRALVGPTTDETLYFELFWADDSIMIQVRGTEILVETQTGWLPDGLRRVVHSRTRTITEEQAKAGFQLTMWFTPEGGLDIYVDGDYTSHTPFPTWPDWCTKTPFTELRVTARPGAAAVGGVVLVSSSDRSVLGTWERNFHLKADTDHMLWGSPALHNMKGLELLQEQAAAELSTFWIDEEGTARYMSRTAMDDRPSTRTLTASDIVNTDWRRSRSSVFSFVDMVWKQPKLFQNRLRAGNTATVWEGDQATLTPGDSWEELAVPQDGEDWFHVDTRMTKASTASVSQLNAGRGSVLGAITSLDEDGDGQAAEAPAAVSWYYGNAYRDHWQQYRVNVTYRPPENATADLILSIPELPGLAKRRTDKGPILRARGLQTWHDVQLDAPKPAAKNLPRKNTHVHDGGWWCQSQLVAHRITNRLAQMLAVPIPAWGPLTLAVPDLGIRLGDTISLELDGVAKPQRVAGVSLSFDDGRLEQQLTLRQIRP